MATSLSSPHYTGWKMICHSSSLFLIGNEDVRIWFPGKLWTGRYEFPVGQFARFAYSSARNVVKFLSNIKEELNSECVLNFSTCSSLRHLRQPLHHDPSAFCRVILGGKCALSGNRMKSVRLGGKYRSIRHTKISEIQTGFLVKWNAPQPSKALKNVVNCVKPALHVTKTCCIWAAFLWQTFIVSCSKRNIFIGPVDTVVWKSVSFEN